MGRGSGAFAIVACGIWTIQGRAQAPVVVLDVKPGTVGSVAAQIGARSGITITVTDPTAARLRSAGVRARVTIKEALVRALAGTGLEAVFYDASLVRVVRSRVLAPVRRPAKTPPPQVAAAPSADDVVAPDIVVTATKQRISPDRYPGTVAVVGAEGDWILRNGSEGTAAIARSSPLVQSTDLGQGRDKFFIRGVADSSFRGQTQAATGQYLGDVRLTYNAPDPSLNLYDMKRIEILAGPQAPLYGAGSLGGVIRLVPYEPDVYAPSARIAGDLASTRFGGLSRNSAAMVNLPIIEGHLAARFVVFDARRAGYIDAPAQGLKDINETRSHGHRAVLRIANVDGWTVDLGDVQQVQTVADGQYTFSDAAPLTRDVPLRQPFTNRYRLRFVTVRKETAEVELTSTTARIRHRLSTRFDAAPLFGIGATFDERDDIDLIEHETRWSGGRDQTSWVAGISGIRSISDTRSQLSNTQTQVSVAAVRRSFDGAVFGQLTSPFGEELSATLGGRVTYTNSTAAVVQSTVARSARFSRRAGRLSRMAALGWKPDSDLSAFLRYEQGYRAGGLSVFPTEEGDFSQTYDPDTLDTVEFGIRLGDQRRGRLTFRASAFASTWANVQADIVTIVGITATANVGRGFIQGLNTEAIWRPSPSLDVRAELFVNNSRLIASDSQNRARRDRLPNVAAMGGRLAAMSKHQISNGRALSLNASARYVGRSWLGVGNALNIPQGNFLVTEFGGGFEIGATTINLQVENLTDVRGNTFAYGNPFTALDRRQVTPLRPLTVRLSFEHTF